MKSQITSIKLFTRLNDASHQISDLFNRAGKSQISISNDQNFLYRSAILARKHVSINKIANPHNSDGLSFGISNLDHCNLFGFWCL